MNDPTPTPDDDLIRRALQGEAEGVQASDELLDRTLAAARRPPVGTSRRLLVAAAIVAAVAIGAGVAVTRDDERQVDSAGDPGTTTTTANTEDLLGALGVLFPCRDGDVLRLSLMVDGRQAPAVLSALESDDRAHDVTATAADDVAAALGITIGSVSADDVPSAFSATFATEENELAVRSVVSDLPGVLVISSTNCDQGGPTTSQGPSVTVLVREDGWLVLVDLRTGDERELYFGGDPEASSSDQEEGGARFIDAVDLSPNGKWIYFSTCCEPASSLTYRISVHGGEPERIATGAHPRVSPDGRYVATSTGDFLAITPADGGDTVLSAQLECCPSRLAWSPDGRQLAYVVGVGTPDPPEVFLFAWDGTSLTPADTGKPSNPGSFVSWTPDGMLTVTSGGPVEDDRSLTQDSTYEWLLWVDQAGAVLVQAGHESSARTRIDGLPEALVADW